ncbi:Nif3-like dinuclear metal center hexameric protein [Alicyclobacillus fodiniaquatilis]|jgi:dinuclear metal center YbgI/SA1388 family protein|uniref:GTP cyclohydrolase 1 type 2 homolog n=1 Tax=Alicyclobacillus fodiniaquatilis TaxID=1661150 RepID=A0ABW4JQF9_9BACL
MTTPIYARDIIAAMEEIAPAKLALPKDKIGLQVGNVDKLVKRVWVALEASPETIAAAAHHEVDMLVTHHALLFHPLAQLDTGQARHRAIQQLLQADMVVFSAHTNLDVAPGGVNDVIAQRLSLQDVEILDVTYRSRLYKLVIYVPTTHVHLVREAICAAGAGSIGNYAHCTFSATGQGTFMPGEGTSPFIGERGQLAKVEETRLETVVPESRLTAVLQQMHAAHPYEEVAYDILHLHQTGEEYGIGRVGQLAKPLSLAAFAEQVRDAFGMSHIRFAGEPSLEVERVAVLGGSGSHWAQASLAQGAQVLVTADVGHHDAADAMQDGLAIVEATHAALEQPVCEVLAAQLRQQLGADAQVDISASPVSVDPFTWL